LLQLSLRPVPGRQQYAADQEDAEHG
jgi:hypothetical protein